MAETLLAWLEVGLLVGLLYSPVSVGLAWAFRIMNYPDLTCEGTFMLSGAVSIVLLNSTGSIVLCIFAGVVVGLVAGGITACLHVCFRISRLLSGIVTWALAYSLTIRVLGGLSNVASEGETLFSGVDGRGGRWIELSIAGVATVVTVVGAIMLARSRWGRATRAFGDQPWFSVSIGFSSRAMTIGGLACANVFIAVGGVLLCQFRHVCDVNMSSGVLISGLASVVMGEAVFDAKHVWQHLVAVCCGTVIYNLAIGTFYFDWGMGLEKVFLPSDVRLISGLLLLVPAAIVARKRRRYRLFASEW